MAEDDKPMTTPRRDSTGSAVRDQALLQLVPEEAVPDRVLIVDDDDAVRYVLSRMLGHGGLPHTAVASAEEALAALATQTFGCLLADKNLVGMSGLELVRATRDRAPFCSCVVITGFASVDSTIEALRLGADDYMQKPVEHPELVVERLRTLIRRRREEFIRSQRLASLVVRDPLTGLFNHVHFHRELQRAVQHAVRGREPVSILFIDMDGFKQVNDNLGHQVGDDVLVKFANLLSPSLRAEDTVARLRSHDILARYGGDEFAAILYATPKVGAATTAERLRRTVESHDFGIPGFRRQTVSIGVATLPDDAADREALVGAADTALYACKHAGRNRVMVYNEQFSTLGESRTQAVRESVSRLEALDVLVSERRAHFEFQPIVRLNDGALFAYEALFRPDVAELAAPQVAIDTAAKAGRIQDLGKIMRELAAAAVEKLPPSVLLFVNLHPHELNDESIYEPEPFFARCASQVVLELTGLSVLKDAERIRDQAIRLRDRGFSLGTDDLGASYLSLAIIAAVEPRFVKVDMSLFRKSGTDRLSALAFKHFVSFSKDLGVEIVARGVETDDECSLVRDAGINLAQGYLFARPSIELSVPSWRPA